MKRLSWIRDLAATYDNNQDKIAKDLEAKAILLPIAHSTQNAQIEIILDEAGTFIRASKVAKADAVTIIPVTEDSASRSSGDAPHPLEDNLKYIAGDYEKFTGIDNKSKHEKYIALIQGWSGSTYSCKQVDAVKEYINKGCIIEDLIQAKVLEAEDGMLIEAKIEGISQKDAFVRFVIEPSTLGSIDQEKAVYKNKDVFNCYSKYYTTLQEDVALCYATGKEIPCSSKHPAKIRHAADKAKLISANDSSGFTFRGRFSEKEQVASIGYETSQKAHNALRWLIGIQGFSVGEQAVVAWEIHGKSMISPVEDTFDALWGKEDDQEEIEAYTNETYAKRLKLASHGYQADLSTDAEVVVMGVEAATTGRLSINFYKKVTGAEFIENVLGWHRTCFWRHQYRKDVNGKYEPVTFVGAPSPRDIATVAFGNRNDKLLKATIERLLPCIVDKRPIPRDVVRAALMRASNASTFESKQEHQKAVSITCALIRKSQYDYKKEEWGMALDRENTDRSYVFGRLLGAAQKLEEVALYHSNEKGRSTSAERFSQQFVRRPGKTWKIINDNLRPYIAKLKGGGQTWYMKELQEIYDLISEEDFQKQEPLSELYLLGYNCQLNSYTKKDKETTEK
ncbi:MAG: type I-C CRISPR-associated protein Cas8c/Csd1 [Cellulosilyticaceae bacterium]